MRDTVKVRTGVVEEATKKWTKVKELVDSPKATAELVYEAITEDCSFCNYCTKISTEGCKPCPLNKEPAVCEGLRLSLDPPHLYWKIYAQVVELESIEGLSEPVNEMLEAIKTRGAAWIRELDTTEKCGAYAEHWKELGKPEGWKGCSLPKGHEGNHTDD